jgi:hypothetical protein
MRRAPAVIPNMAREMATNAK